MIDDTRRVPLQRVAIAGTAGPGKTTLARRLAHNLGVPHVELDAIQVRTYHRRRREYSEPIRLPEYVHLNVIRLSTPRSPETWLLERVPACAE